MAGGLAWTLVVYARMPAPPRMATTPAPTTVMGVIGRLVRELVLFESLFRASKWTWLFGWLFHAGLLLVLVQHLRYVTADWWAWVAWVHAYGIYASAAMTFGLLGLWARRIFVARVRYVTSPSDHLMLALLVALAASGMFMKYAAPVDVVAVKGFMRGVLFLDWQYLPASAVLWLHVALASVLLLVFPFSKLLHAPGLFFSPTRNQADDPRERG